MRLRKRLQKVIVHEVGHSLSLPHCQHHNTCIMVDVGKPKSSIDRIKTTFCAKCRKQIEPYLKANQGQNSNTSSPFPERSNSCRNLKMPTIY
ncbi:MAG: hypothetical protein ACKOAV_00625 [Bacteroidota bacterium]